MQLGRLKDALAMCGGRNDDDNHDDGDYSFSVVCVWLCELLAAEAITGLT